MKQLGDLASDAVFDILDNHPQIKKKVDGDIDKLKPMVNSYGPEAKEKLDWTHIQIKEVLAGGVGIDTANKIEIIIQEGAQKVEKIGDEIWKKGMEQAKPYLDQNTQVKDTVEKNADTLKQGNNLELCKKLKKGTQI